LDTTTTGVKKITGLAAELPAGRYVTALRCGVAMPSLRAIRGSVPGGPLNPVLGTNSMAVYLTAAAAYGEWAADGPNWTAYQVGITPLEYMVFTVLSAVA
jgi:hypothetical protein